MNNKRKTNNIYTRLATVLLMVAGLLMVENVWADGSRDLYPSGVKGGRAYLRASTTESAAFPFANLGTHYVYAEAGERIALATSAQAYGTNNSTRNNNRNNISLYAPDGIQITLSTGTNADTRGLISNRTAELAGPQLPNQSGGDRYTPIFHEVTVSGIYKVEYLSTSRSTTGDARMNYVEANSNWTQSTSSNYLSAWDISVAKQSGSSWSWQTGRVYTNVLNMDNPSYGGSSGSDNNSFRTSSGFYGNFKVLTRDGYVYNVGNNGSQGISFTFMVNNRGFHEVGNKNIASYKSIDASSASTVQNRYHDPRSADAEAAVTHKIFYNIPDQSMPKEAKGGPVNGNFTWLHPEQQNLEVADMQVEGVDATVAQISNKGGYVIFENNSGGDYTITISPNISDPNYEATMDFETRVLQGQSYPGVNRIYFDGKDGVGDYLPQGNIPVEITIQLQGAEVHFPYIDMELNHFGIVIELLEGPNYQTALSDKVYWDDSGIGNGGGSNGSKSNPINASHTAIPLGTSSKTNGHIWGTGSNATASTFGDNMGMDTWTFIKGESYTQAFALVNKVADLSIESIEVDKTEGVYVGDTLTYTVVVANKKGSCPVEGAAFSFILPEGFEGLYDEADITFTSSSSCGSESVAVTYDSTTRTFNSKLNLGGSCDATGGNCTVTYTFKARVTDQSDPANTNAIATIMRPNDVTDPDATNTSSPDNPNAPEGVVDLENYYYPPTDPFFEVEHNGMEGVSNNIKDILVGLTRESDLAIVKTANAEEAKIGDVVIFTLTVTNNGPHDAVGVVVTDNVPAGYTINNSTISDEGAVTNNVITWNVGELAKGQEVVLTFQTTVKNSGPYLNTATVDGDVEDPDLMNNESSVDPVLSKNYWIGGTTDKMNDWAEPKNWTAERVPDEMEDIEFATEANNPTDASKPSSGPAKEDLHLDIDRNIGDLINKSDKDLIVTLENELVIHGKVHDDNTGGIVVQADPEKPAGTLIFKDPGINNDVDATVQFYNKAYECDNCGFYRKQWQYFGVPVKSAEFPFDDVTGTETVNRWDETYNGDKWRPTTGALSAFVGYQITNNVTTLPTGVYNFNGKLTVGDATVALTKTASVNYSGTNLVGNSYTAAIPISTDAMTFPTGAEQTVYLFNTGTRDQWRKLNGQAINQDGYRSGQYLAVPLNLGGTSEFPDRIPSTHSFMILTEGSGDLHINYVNLTKNTKVNRGDGTEIVTRSVDNNSASVIGAQNNNSQLPSLVMDVIGDESADRVWIFKKQGSSHNFNNGWDGRKMLEDGIAQLYVNATDDSKLQVATVPELNSVSLGFIADTDGEYTFEFAQMGQLKGTDIYLHDAVTGTTHEIEDGKSYSFTAKKGESPGRFRLSSKDNGTFLSADEALLDVSTKDGAIMIVNASSNVLSAFVYDSNGAFVQRVEVDANGKASIKSGLVKGMYMVRLQNSEVNDVRRVTVE